MGTASQFDAWSAGHNYECYMGRWSRQVARRYVDWLEPPQGADWLEVGCGTGALTSAVHERCAPRSVLSIDQSADFVAHSAVATADKRARFERADALALPAEAASVDVVTSGLVFNFIADRPAALAEMQRVLRPGGLLSFYVWDYPGGGMGFINAFWKAAVVLDPDVAELGEGRRFPFCTHDGLVALCEDAGLADVSAVALEIETRFEDIDAYWHPFTLGSGPAPGYCASLDEGHRNRLKAQLATQLGDSDICLVARAWAVQGGRR